MTNLRKTGETTTPPGERSGSQLTEWYVATSSETKTESEERLSPGYYYGGETIEEACRKWNAEIRDLGDEQYDLNGPLSIVIEEYLDEKIVIARHPELEVFGEGEDEADAIRYLKEDIIRLYEDLINKKADSLGPLPRGWQRILKKIISRV